ncbi:hypothetical protein [Litoribrevibacter albus]|uniref:Uncharacterized protein n=1 Tax=Litoribrevibacter albus TaxID=1473156 RepID=A0AA37W7Z4_9GAMM|nr:hypothetical protein [Litoribrevibacter albus]GLQ31948.1 hypothetical protein GCM10007876_24270 [Litoribrevibacter albus]
MLTALISFLGVVIGASLQYFFTKHIENQRHLRDLRSQAYMDYLKCVCEQAQFRPKLGSKEQQELFSRTGDAKSRICLYGSREAISAFSNFEKLGASMARQDQRDAFTTMISIMRTDSGSELCEDTTDLQNVILGVRE